MEIKVRHIESQHIQADIVGKSAVWLVYAAEIVEVSTLAERSRLVGIAPIDRGLTGEEYQAMRHPELAGNVARMLFGFAIERSRLALIIGEITDRELGAIQGSEFMRGRERARTWNLWTLRELSAAKGTARLTWVFITGGSSYGKADVEGVDRVDDDIGLACQGGVAGSTGSLCTHRLAPYQEGLEWEAQVTRGGHASFKNSQPRKEPRWERGEGKRSEGGLSVVGHRLLPRDASWV